MSAQIKSRAKKLGKAVGIALFVFLMFFNIKFALSDNSSGDIDLFGLKISVFANTELAKEKVCLYCSDIGCFGGNTLCGQYSCNGVLVQCFTQRDYL